MSTPLGPDCLRLLRLLRVAPEFPPELAARSGLPIRVVRGCLGKLRRAGYAERLEGGQGKHAITAQGRKFLRQAS